MAAMIAGVGRSAHFGYGAHLAQGRPGLVEISASVGVAARMPCPAAIDADDHFVLKPSHCAFYATPLQLLLEQPSARRLVLCGVTSDQCVLATALAAHMRRYKVAVPCDAVASLTRERNRAALHHFQTVLEISIAPAEQLP